MVIEDPYEWRFYDYLMNSKDNQNFYEEGKRVIDAALEIINSHEEPITHKIISDAFSEVYEKTIKENTLPPNPDGIAKKAQLRKTYRRRMILQGVLDFLATTAAVLISISISVDEFYESYILWAMCFCVLVGDLMCIGTSLPKKDSYALGERGKAIAAAASGINGTVPSGYGGGVFTGPRIRYPGLTIAYRVLLIIVCGIAVYELSAPATMYPALFLLVFHIVQFFRDIKTIKITNAYNDLDDNGNSQSKIRESQVI